MRFLYLFVITLFVYQTAFCSKVDSLLIAIKSEKNQNKIVDIYNKLSKEYKSINLDSSLFYIKKAYTLSVKLKYEKGKANACYNYGLYYRANVNLDSSWYWYQKAFEYYTICNDTMEKSRTLTAIGNVFTDKNEYIKAIKYFKESIKLKKLLKDKKGIAINLYNIANQYYYNIKNYKLGLDNYTKAIEIFTEIDYKPGLAICLNSIGNLYEDWGNYDLALKSYNKALKIQNDKSNQIDLFLNIGKVYTKSQNYDNALIYFFKALDYSKEIQDIEKEAISLKSIGVLYSDINEFDKSKQYLNNSLNIAHQIKSDKLEVEILSSIGYCYLFQNNCKASLDYLLKSQELAEKIEDKDFITSNYIFLSEAYMCIGDGQKAKEFFKKYIAAQDNNNKELNDLRIKYETEKQDKEIQLLNKQKQLGEEQLKTKTAESKTQRIIIFAAFFFILIFIVSIILITQQYRQKRKANELLGAQNKQIIQQNAEITIQRDKLSEQKIEIEDSINYALRIQRAVLPIDKNSAEDMPGDYFLIFRPKYIVAGDYFWTKRVTDHLIIAVADCTGHGVPGAFMSMLGVSFLNEIVRKTDITQANHVLNHLRLYIIDALKQKGISGEQKDGMDMSLCVINVKTLELQYAGANNPLYIVRGGQNPQGLTKPEPLQNLEGLEEIKGDKMPVAIYERMNDFTNHIIHLKTGDKIYMFSDGYADQFGGVKGKKFMYKPFKRLIAETSNLSIKEQGNHLEKVLSEWTEHKDFNTGTSYEQTDDITVFGLEIKHNNYIL